jgi:hypothetical protein
MRRTASLSPETCLNESFEQQVGFVWSALKFWVILAADKIRMIAKLDQFSEGAIR